MSKKYLLILIVAALLSTTVTAGAVCVRDGQWGEGHQYRCLEDNTYDSCRTDLSGYDHVNTCRYVCSASLECNQKSPGTIINSCDKYGSSFLVDYCDSECQLADGNCENDFAGCSASESCDSMQPGQNGCDQSCQKHTCGDGIIDLGEQCETPGSEECSHCQQTTTVCNGKQQGVRDSLGDCGADCQCDNEEFTYSCSKGACGAECSVDADCDDGNPDTSDSCLANCECVNTMVCGNHIINPGEECELPNTPNNAYCSQGDDECMGYKLGTRDTLGRCDSKCQCQDDSFTYQCVQGECGAECDCDADCNDGDATTLDRCDSNCLCSHTKTLTCGNRKVDFGEQCELPSTFNNHFCYQPMTECNGKKLGIRDAYGNCNSDCGCNADSFNYMCVKDVCGATCDSDSQCDDKNPNTLDKCVECACQHTTGPSCGDGTINGNEACERPGSVNNNKCTQSTSKCEGMKLGTRDSYGNCNSQCQCNPDQFNYECSDDCGAECETNNDCSDGNPNTIDICGADCMCHNDDQPYCGDGKTGSGEECEGPSTDDNQDCAQTTEQCSNGKYGTRESFGDCSDSCQCEATEFTFACEKGKCGGECACNDDCNDGNPATTDACGSNCKCEHKTIPPECGNNIVQSGEQCELPRTDNNNFCGQRTEECLGKKTGTRDPFGFCDIACQCIDDIFTYSCMEGKCGAECDSEEDCGQSACRSIYYDYCIGTKLVDYNDNDAKDNFAVEQSCDNSCTNSCNCIGCTPDCSAPVAEKECVIGACGASCADNEDCDDGNSFTIDTCQSNCTCVHREVPPTCGNNHIEIGEQCELPDTESNSYCIQTTEDCIDNKYGTRCKNGNCDAACACESTEFEYSCTEGKCGAECDENDDCGNTTYTKTFDDYCEDNKLVEYKVNGKEDSLTITKTCDNTCTDGCLCEKCADDFPMPETEKSCVEGICRAECDSDDDCDNGGPFTSGRCMDNCTCVYDDVPHCGDGEINLAGETCEYPETDDNINCEQNAEDCKNGQYGTRDRYGDCNSECGCLEDVFEYSCVKDKCHAECGEDEDCGDTQCNATYLDYCAGKKLADYNDNEENDSISIFDECGNSCGNDCGCEECTTNCSAPKPVIACQEGICGATCGDNDDCEANSCNATFNDYCSSGRLIDYNRNRLNDSVFVWDSCENNCTDSCGCTDCAVECHGPEPQSVCVTGTCGATCEKNSDCDDDNYRTNDTCNNGCECEHKCMPGTTEVENGVGVKVCMGTEDFPPKVFLCNSRVLLGDNVNVGSHIAQRIENYAFEGEKIVWNILVLDKNGINKVKDVYVSVGQEQCIKNPIQANCKYSGYIDPAKCNARIGEEKITKFDSSTMAGYVCTLTVETQESMHGQYWIAAQAVDLTGLLGAIDEKEHWFFNPNVGLEIDGEVDFGKLRPGTTGYSPTIKLENNAEEDSGVLMNMFISGTDFYDAGHAGAMCPTTNQLLLKNFAYYATSGSHDTRANPSADAEGYNPIVYGNKIYKAKSVIGAIPYPANSPLVPGNVLTPGAEMAITLRLKLPEPCTGTFSDGQIYFWGEAI